jgi:NADH-ubiquinone oxidoreductase chain 3
MTSFNLFSLFSIIVALLFLIINFLFAEHLPYLEKDSPFECGYHSFLGQSRNQFNIAFFLVGLFFLIFDLEIVLLFPYAISSSSNESSGFTIFILFTLILTAGFGFEIGKDALSIISRQFSSISNDTYKELKGFNE